MKSKSWSLVLAGVALGSILTTLVFIIALNARPATKPDTNLTSEQKLELYKKIKQSAVVVRATFGSTVSYGSGVIVLIDQGRMVALTNAHVITQNRQISPKVEVKAYGSRVYRSAKVLKAVYEEKEQLDLAFVLFTDATSRASAATLVPPDESIAAGQLVFAVGNPMGEEFFSDSGSLVEVRTKGPLKLLVHNATTEHGSSGGGLFDRHAHLIGINTWLLGQDQGVAVEINSLMEAYKEAMKD